MRPSVLSTLRETLVIWFRHGGFFLLLAFFLLFPKLVLPDVETHRVGHKLDFSVGVVERHARSTVLVFIFRAAGCAAALGLLSHPPGEKRWRTLAQAVHRYTGRLVGVQALLWLIYIGPVLGMLMISRIHQAAFSLILISTVLVEIVFLLLLKYALANPLVVVEDLSAPTALAVSWRMTKRRFAYVFGCYLLIGSVEAGVTFASVFLRLPRWTSPEIGLLNEFFATYSYVLSWVMYSQIRAAEKLEQIPLQV